jgi:excisionase family DNA binding protein
MCVLVEIMTTKELAEYLRLHEVTISKYAAGGQIPATRIGRLWRFDKEAIDKWLRGDQKIVRKKERKKSAIDIVLDTIKKSKKGIGTIDLKKKTGFSDQKIWTIIYRLKQQGKVRSLRRGVYVKT